MSCTQLPTINHTLVMQVFNQDKNSKKKFKVLGWFSDEDYFGVIDVLVDFLYSACVSGKYLKPIISSCFLNQPGKAKILKSTSHMTQNKRKRQEAYVISCCFQNT